MQRFRQKWWQNTCTTTRTADRHNCRPARQNCGKFRPLKAWQRRQHNTQCNLIDATDPNRSRLIQRAHQTMIRCLPHVQISHAVPAASITKMLVHARTMIRFAICWYRCTAGDKKDGYAYRISDTMHMTDTCNNALLDCNGRFIIRTRIVIQAAGCRDGWTPHMMRCTFNCPHKRLTG